jgi:signal peptidase I
MNPTAPPPLPRSRPVPLNGRLKLLIGLSLVPALFVGAWLVLRLCGLVRLFSVPAGSMTPAVAAGDHVMMEGVTFRTRKPRRGEVVVFKTEGMAALPPATIYVKRLVGEPGDQVRIADGKLHINGGPVTLSNAVGAITYRPHPGSFTMAGMTNVTVPDGQCYVLGDNSLNSHDSRYWGCVPAGNILGRVVFCYWPPSRMGRVK